MSVAGATSALGQTSDAISGKCERWSAAMSAIGRMYLRSATVARRSDDASDFADLRALVWRSRYSWICPMNSSRSSLGGDESTDAKSAAYTVRYIWLLTRLPRIACCRLFIGVDGKGGTRKAAHWGGLSR